MNGAGFLNELVLLQGGKPPGPAFSQLQLGDGENRIERDQRLGKIVVVHASQEEEHAAQLVLGLQVFGIGQLGGHAFHGLLRGQVSIIPAPVSQRVNIRMHTHEPATGLKQAFHGSPQGGHIGCSRRNRVGGNGNGLLNRVQACRAVVQLGGDSCTAVVQAFVNSLQGRWGGEGDGGPRHVLCLSKDNRFACFVQRGRSREAVFINKFG